MYIHLGQETVVKKQDVIGIFDMDTATVSRHTRKYLNLAEKNGEVVNITYELPKSFIVCAKPKEKKKYVFTEKNVSNRFFSNDRKSLLKEVKAL